MKTSRTALVLIALLTFTLSALPLPALAATKKASCALDVSVAGELIHVPKSADVLVPKGSLLTINWSSKNATNATGPSGAINTEGSETFTPTKSTTYKYTFNGSKKATCVVKVRVAEAALISTQVLSSKPTLTGTASGTKKVTVEVRKDGVSKVLFKKQVSVKKGAWSAKVSKSLASGSYDVTLLGEKKYDVNTLATTTLVVGGTQSSSTSSADTSTLSVSTVPLLWGGTTSAGASVPVAYLQIKNVGPSPATFTGVRLKQTGSASVTSIVGLEVRDDKGVTRGIDVRQKGSTPFNSDNTATAPATVTLAAGEMRLFTVRAILSSSAQYAGQTLVIDVLGLDGKSKGLYPLKGVTWTIR